MEIPKMYANQFRGRQGEAEMWESCKIGENDLLPEKEHDSESFEGEVDSKADEDSFDRVNGLSSTENIDN
ncbi:hypothetical protein GIB67_011212, partial [Kingdonia uniflora]